MYSKANLKKDSTRYFYILVFDTDTLRMDSAVKISDEPLRVILWAVVALHRI